MSQAPNATTPSLATSRRMNAIGFFSMPEISKVDARIQMLNLETPPPKPKQVVIRLRASAMHIDEIYAAQGTALGRFFAPKNLSQSNPYILGSSVSGIIVGLGEGVHSFKTGDEVIVIPNEKGESGSWAEYRRVDEKMVMLKPPSLSHVEAAAVTMASCVAWSTISFANVRAGSECVVVGASGSIGIMVVQFLKSLGCHVTAVCSAPNETFVRKHGADEVIDYRSQDFGEVLSGRGTLKDAVFDCVGGRDIEAKGFRALKAKGRFMTVVGPERYIGEKRLSWWAFAKVIAYIGLRMFITLFRGRRYLFAEKYPRLVIDDALAQVVRHDIRMPVQDVIPFDVGAIVSAIRTLTSHRAKGRIVIDFTKS